MDAKSQKAGEFSGTARHLDLRASGAFGILFKLVPASSRSMFQKDMCPEHSLRTAIAVAGPKMAHL